MEAILHKQSLQCIVKMARYLHPFRRLTTEHVPRTRMHPALLDATNRYATESASSGRVTMSIRDDAPIAEVVLDNPSKRNAFDGKMMLDLERIVCEMEAWDDGIAVLFYGKGDGFCAGGDLGFVESIATPELGRHLSEFMTDVTERIRCLPQLTCCYVHGKALGGGAELTTAFDMRVFARLATVEFVQARLKVTTGWGGASRLIQLIGRLRAQYHLTTCMPIPFAVAKQIGYCDLAVNEDDGVDVSRMWLCDYVATRDARLIRDYKSFVLDPTREAMRESYKAETEMFTRHWGGEAHIDAVRQRRTDSEARSTRLGRNVTPPSGG